MIFFLNSANRVYNDRELNKVAGILFGDGVFNTVAATLAAWRSGGDFLVEGAGGSMNITARPGSASTQVLSEGETQRIIITEDNQLSAAVAANVGLAQRNDAVVLRVLQSVITGDTLNSAGSNAVVLTVISGSSATALTDAEISVALGSDPFIRLANILVPLGASEITQSMITDVRSMVSASPSVKLGSSILRTIPMTDDPTDLQQGDIWYNSTERILKMYNGESVISLQTEDFDWGYYPPNGIASNAEDFEPVAEVSTDEGVGAVQVYQVMDPGNPSNAGSNFCGQVFVMPDIANPFIRVKLGNPEYQGGVVFDVYSVNGSYQPVASIQGVGSFAPGSAPVNDWVDLNLDGSLYTPGTAYMLIARVYQPGWINAGDSDFKIGIVQTGTREDDSVFKVFKSTGVGSYTSNPLSATWNTSTDGDGAMLMTIAERGSLALGRTDVSGHAYKVSQAFTAKSKDMTGFILVSGADTGSPTDDINATLYAADNDDLPTGPALATALITETDWLAGSLGSEMEFPIDYDLLVVGERYVVVIETEDHDDDNYYTVLYGAKASGGGASRWNTANGWVALNGDLYFSVRTSSAKKIPTTGDDGKIPAELIPVVPPRVVSLASSATPAYNVDDVDAVVIPALATNITDMSTYLLGTPSDFQRLRFRITASGGIRTVAWGTKFAASGVALDTSIASGKTLNAEFWWDAVLSKFTLISSSETA